MLLRIAGASVSYYYAANSTSQNPNIIPNLLASLSSVITNGTASVGTLTHGAATGITNNLSPNSLFVNSVEPNSYTSGVPQAYLTILFFDERFNFIAAADGGVAQMQVRSTDAGNTNAAPLALPNVKAPKNGYAYIYISNRSDQDVFFDNLSINITTGNIIEENHYYAFGLRIAAISSTKLGDSPEGNLQNNYKYQGSFSEMDADIGWNDFELRNYDPQIGRFVQQDPYEQFSSTYPAFANDPISNIDPGGGWSSSGIFEGLSTLGKIGVTTIGSAIIGEAGWLISGHNDFKGALFGAVAGFGSNFISGFSWKYLFNIGQGINFYVAPKFNIKSSANAGDLIWAASKSMFSFGKLKIITGNDQVDKATRIKKILGNNHKIGTMIIDSEAHPKSESNHDPRTTSLAIGEDDEADRITANTDISNVPFFKILEPYVTNSTKVILGNCWSGSTNYQPVLQNISNFWTGATVFGQASENRSMSLFYNNSFTSPHYGHNGGDAAKIKFKYGYDDRAMHGIYFSSQYGNLERTNIVKFGSGAGIN